MEIFCFLLGILYGYYASIYLPLLALALLFITPKYSLILFFTLGVVHVWTHQLWIAPNGLPKTAVIAHALIEGRIASIPVRTNNKTQFTVDLQKMNNKPAQGLVHLSWYNHPPVLKAGQQWQLAVKLKKPHNFQNPGGFDYVTSLTKKHIFWTGYIRRGPNKLLSTSHSVFNWLELRESLGNQLAAQAPDEQVTGIIQALTLNLTPHISQDDWNLFRRTGTTHLFGISGEHVALLSGLFFWLTRKLWVLSPRLCLYLPATAIASCVGLSIAIFYAFLAGFEPPVQRALMGCFFYTLCAMGKQRFTPWQVWRYALFAVLCLEPHAVFMQGFYFSFLAVACILLTHQRWQFKGYKGTLALQLSCLMGLMPLTLYWFSYGSINGFIANLFAIPLVGFLIVPLALLTMLFGSFDWSWLLMTPLSWLTHCLLLGLTWTEQLAFINITWPLDQLAYVICFSGALLLWAVLPVKPFKYIALLWLVLPFFPSRLIINPGEALIQVLDVGQGLAVSVRTQNHVLLYDTGDQFFQGSDMGKMVILPFYQNQRIQKLDAVVISHPDKDHWGGLKSIQEALIVKTLLVNEPKFYHQGMNCHEYPAWEWDGVLFRFLPIENVFHDKNNNSCILQISTETHRILLAGDVEKPGEDYLVTHYNEQLGADIFIVPHHGSKTSSTYRFLLEVNPKYAIASLGFDNRFHFPHAKTLTTLQSLNIPLFRTDECGMTEVILPKQGEIKPPRCYARMHEAY